MSWEVGRYSRFDGKRAEAKEKRPKEETARILARVRDGAASHLSAEFGSLAMREEYGESTGKNREGFCFCFCFVFLGVWDPSIVQRQKQSCLD